MDTPRPRGIVIFGGGTATNSLVDIFNDLRESRGCPLSYVIPISDNGGSSSELIRVLGGPGIGDIRSRLVRLIPDKVDDANSADLIATKALFNYRLSSDPVAARVEWLDIVEGRHELWAQISSDKRELIRSVFNMVNMEIVKRARPSSTFNFGRAAVGNMFLSGARLFTGSVESSIYLLSQICAIPPSTSVLPAINSNFTHHISAGLADGTVITGQNSISHPSEPTSVPDSGTRAASTTANLAITVSDEDTDTDLHDLIEDATLPGSLPTLRKQYITFSKGPAGADAGGGGMEDLPARIARVWYINPYGHEIRPRANPKVVAAVERAAAVVYSIGSLYTSIVPSLVLRGVGAALARAGPRQKKILILNSSNDRETGPSTAPFAAVDFVRAVAAAAAGSQEGGGGGGGATSSPAPSFLAVGWNGAEAAGRTASSLGGAANGQAPAAPTSAGGVVAADVRRYVTHLVHMDGEGTPRVDRAELAALGVDCVRVYGRRVDGVLRYDEAGLKSALEAVIGKAEVGRSRRNTRE